MVLQNLSAKRLVPIAGSVVLIGAVGVAGITTFMAEDTPTGSTMAAPLHLAAMTPVLDEDGMVRYGNITVSSEIDENVVSIGVTPAGLAITYTGEGPRNTLRLVDSTGRLIASYSGVSGIAIAEPTSEIVAFIQDTTPATSDDEAAAETDDTPGVGESFAAVMINSVTGAEVDRVSANALTRVMAVMGGAVAMSDDDASHLWSVGEVPRALTFVPDDFYVVGLSGDRIVATNLDQITMIYDFAGTLISQVGDLVSWSVSNAAEELAGATADGLVHTVDLLTGVVTVLNPSVDAATATYTEDGQNVVVNSEASLSDPSADQNVCPTGPDALCETVTDDSITVLPNEALSQLVANSY